MKKLLLTLLLIVIPVASAFIIVDFPNERIYYEPVTYISYTFSIEPQPYPTEGLCYYSIDGGKTKVFSSCVINSGDSTKTVSFDGLNSVCGVNVWAVGFVNDEINLNKRVKFINEC
jgi:hypothetical protein